MLPAELLLLIAEFMSDVAKKMWLSTTSVMRATLGTYSFRDEVDCRHLSVCPHPEKHFNLIAGPVLINNQSERDCDVYVAPGHITRLVMPRSEGDCLLDMSQCVELREVIIPDYKTSWEDLRTLPYTVECLSFNARPFQYLVSSGTGAKEVVIGFSSSPGLWKHYTLSVPVALKTLTALDVNGKLLTVTIPYKSNTLTVEFV